MIPDKIYYMNMYARYRIVCA